MPSVREYQRCNLGNIETPNINDRIIKEALFKPFSPVKIIGLLNWLS
jgi:hypothetical protein